MRTLHLILAAALLAGSTIHGADDLADKLKRALEKAKDKVGDIAQSAGRKGREWYNSARDNLRLSRTEYTTRAEKKLAELTSDVDTLKELATTMPEYFKTRVQSLQQHVAYTANEMQTLKSSESDATFRSRRTVFNKTLWTLEAAVEQAQEEAGL